MGGGGGGVICVYMGGWVGGERTYLAYERRLAIVASEGLLAA